MHKKNSDTPIQWKSILRLRVFLQIISGCGLAVISINGFMIPNHLIDGGVTGISILVHEIFHINVGFLLILFNLPFIYMGYKQIGKSFAVVTVIAVLILAAGLTFIHIPVITSDRLLIAVFGGISIGTGVGLVIRAGGVIDGAEVIAVFTKRRTGFSNSEIILMFNALLFAMAIMLLGIETSMYSLITFFTATKATEYVVDGIEEYTSMNIISAHPDAIKHLLVHNLGKGITVYKGERGFLPGKFDESSECDIIVTIISRLEIGQLQNQISEIDPNAFVYVQSIKDASGGILKHKHKH